MLKAAKPLVKWAGGKSQLINQIKESFPPAIIQTPFTYIEPFVGGGAVLFWVLANLPQLKKAVINDINPDLINMYKTVANQPTELIKLLATFEKEFHALSTDEENKKIYFYQQRQRYNLRQSDAVGQAALFIFLNRTCFNGLYRVNRKNEYNVPMGSYKCPTICDEENILLVSAALQKVEILCGDFEQTLSYAEPNSLFYFDPPYKPISKSANFNAYSSEVFDDDEQLRLKNFCTKIDNLGYDWIVSNSNPKEKDSQQYFFDNLYASFQIKRIEAKRMINAHADKRGALTELLITNHKNQLVI